MPMNSREFELIAVSHILTRYRLTGELPNINGQPFNINDFRAKLFAGVDNDQDININIDTLKTESNVTIIENTECTEDHRHEPTVTASETPKVLEPTVNNDPPAQPAEQKPAEEPLSPSGRLFQYFNRDR